MNFSQITYLIVNVNTVKSLYFCVIIPSLQYRMIYRLQFLYFLFSLCILLSNNTLAQSNLTLVSSKNKKKDVKWASQLIYVTGSWRESGQFSAEQILGKPTINSFKGVKNPCAWTSDKETNGDETQRQNITDQDDVIRVAFDSAMIIRQVAVVEALNPSAVTKITVFSESGEKKEVYSANPTMRGKNGRILCTFFPPTPFRVVEVEVRLKTADVPDWNQIDAIAISSSSDSVRADINIVQYADKISIEQLDSSVNSNADETAPVISPDGKTLYFARYKHPENFEGTSATDIWYSTLQPDEKSFSKAINIGAPLNDAHPNFVCTITPDGSGMLVANEYVSGLAPKNGVSLSTLNDDGWAFPKLLNIYKFYSRSRQGHYCISSDRKVLLMCIERDDTKGGMDIYVSFFEDDLTWSEPLNIGNSLNTAGNESTVFLAPDTKTLFFSSNGYNGYGDNDVYITTRLDTTWRNWSPPQNLGKLINSEKWDGYFSIDAAAKIGYTVSSSVGEGNSQDIYRVHIPTELPIAPVALITGGVFDYKTKTPIKAQVFFEDLQTGKQIGIAQTNSITGEFRLVLPVGRHYGYRAEAGGYFSVSENIDVRNLKQFTTKKADLFLIPVEKGQNFALNNIFFEFSKSALKDESAPELNRLADMLNEFPTLKLKIIGHTDNVGTEKGNKALSYARARAVANYLISKGTSFTRFEIIGVGDEAPVASNDTEEGRSRNRRVEFSITDH